MQGWGEFAPAVVTLHHHLSLYLHKAEQQQLTFQEQIPLEINKPISSEVWDPPLGSGEHIKNKIQICRLYAPHFKQCKAISTCLAET